MFQWWEFGLLKEFSFYYRGYDRILGFCDFCVYDLVFLEYSLLCDEFIFVLEFGKRYNFDQYYGILILEIMFVFLIIMNSSDQDGICKFIVSFRFLGDGCYVFILVYVFLFYLRLKLCGNENYIYVFDL